MARDLDPQRAFPSATLSAIEGAEWPEDHRVSCGDCAGKSGVICRPQSRQGYHLSIVPVDVLHDCEHFKRRIGTWQR